MKGMNSGHKIGREKGSEADIGISYRVYITCWAAKSCLNVEGDFVECGVNTGIFSLAVCDFLDFNRVDKNFFLFDTYEGIPLSQCSESEMMISQEYNEKFYESCFELAKRNFAPYKNAKLIKGIVPQSLSEVKIDSVAYLQLDMNIAKPEKEALEYLYPKISKGGIVILDDYAWTPHREQKSAIDEVASKLGFDVLTLPTGQGMIYKS